MKITEPQVAHCQHDKTASTQICSSRLPRRDDLATVQR